MMRLTAATIAVGLLLAGGCQPEPDAKAGGIDAAVDLIGEAALKAHLDYLASDELEGREAGEPGYDKAAAYVAEQFAAMGLEPAGARADYTALIEHIKRLTDAVQPEGTVTRLDVDVQRQPTRTARSTRCRRTRS